MAGTRKINKSNKVKHANEPVVNSYDLLDGVDGNPSTPLEHDNASGYEGEMFFEVDDDADEDAKKRVLILNFIHQELKHITERKVPVLDHDLDNPNVEVYHRVTFQGVELDVCVYWAPRVEGDYKTCVAMVKFTSEDPSAEKAGNGHIKTDAAWNADSKTDKFTLKNDTIMTNYWAPRWKYVVNALKRTAYSRFEKNGVEKPPEPEPVAEVDNEENESQEEREEPMSVFCGSTGKIIGPKGSMINMIKKDCGVKDVKMPAKNHDPSSRPKARELVEITIIGKPRAIAKAREMIQEVVDEWANDRPPKTNGSIEPPQLEYGNGSDDNFGGGGGGYNDWDTQAAGGGGNNWADGAAQNGGRGGGGW